jgi:hypothetical protein
MRTVVHTSYKISGGIRVNSARPRRRLSGFGVGVGTGESSCVVLGLFDFEAAVTLAVVAGRAISAKASLFRR